MSINIDKLKLKDAIGVHADWDYFITRRDAQYYGITRLGGIAYQGGNFVYDVFQPCLNDLTEGGVIQLDRNDFNVETKALMKYSNTKVRGWQFPHNTLGTRLLGKLTSRGYMIQIGDDSHIAEECGLENLWLFADDSIGSSVINDGINLYNVAEVRDIEHIFGYGNKLGHNLRVDRFYQGVIRGCELNSYVDTPLYINPSKGQVNLLTLENSYAITRVVGLKAVQVTNNMWANINWYGGEFGGVGTALGSIGFDIVNATAEHAILTIIGTWIEGCSIGIKSMGGAILNLKALTFGSVTTPWSITPADILNYEGLGLAGYTGHGTITG